MTITKKTSMNGRRQFMKLVPALAAPAIATASSGDLHESAGGEHNSILGTWIFVITVAFPPATFREFATFAEGGVLHETNSFVHTSSNSNFSPYGLPSIVNVRTASGLGRGRELANLSSASASCCSTIPA